MAPQQVELKKKLTPKDMNPKRLLGLPKDGDGAVSRLLLGRLIGVASDITTSEGKDGELLEGLKGRFKFTPADHTVRPMASQVLWFPSGFGGDIIEALQEKDDKGERKTLSIEFGFDCTVTRAENPAGYEWALTPLIAPREHDPLAQLENRMKPGEHGVKEVENKGAQAGAASAAKEKVRAA